MVSEDFSFPKVRNPAAHFSLSPSLWRVTSLVYPDYDQDEAYVSGESLYTIECETEKDANVVGEPRDDKNGLYFEELLSEETMDMLWERLNEEQQRIEVKGSKLEEDSDKGKMANICSVNEFKMSNAANSVISQKTRPRFVVLVKLLKKLFLLHNSAKFKNP